MVPCTLFSDTPVGMEGDNLNIKGTVIPIHGLHQGCLDFFIHAGCITYLTLGYNVVSS